MTLEALAAIRWRVELAESLDDEELTVTTEVWLT